jgi:hypothetical protein
MATLTPKYNIYEVDGTPVIELPTRAGGLSKLPSFFGNDFPSSIMSDFQLSEVGASEYIVMAKLREKYLNLLKQIKDTMSTAPYVVVQRSRQPYKLESLCNGGYVGSMIISLGGFYLRGEIL